jgi:NitT/TauT family transport system substrate-binding protein
LTFNSLKEAMSPDGMISEEGTKTALKSLVAFDDKIKADAIDLNRTFTNEFVKRAPK